VNVARWALAYAALWFFFALLIDIGDTAELAAALAGLIAISATVMWLPTSLTNLNRAVNG
jgi:hypothetical protein